MAVATGLAIAGALAGAYGAKKQADAAKSAASGAAFHPYNVQGPMGNVNFSGNTASFDPNAQMGNLTNLLGSNAQNLLGGQGYSPEYQQFAQMLGGQAIPGLFGDALGASQNLPYGSFGQNQSLLNSLTGQAQGAAGGLFQGGQQFLGGQNLDLQSLIGDRLGMLRQQAAPFEERSLDSLQQRLFSQGRMGSTGGSLDMEAFARGLGQNDLSRQLAAQDYGMQAQAQNANLGLGMFGLGNDLLGSAGNFSNMGLNNAMSLSDATNSRAQQRLSNAQSLFGFGSEMQNRDYTQGIQSLQGQGLLNSQFMDMIALGGNIGGARAGAGANQGQFLQSSPWGSLLGSLGNSMLLGSRKETGVSTPAGDDRFQTL